jgi:hypothetical protein
MAVGFPVKADYITGDVLTANNMNDLSGSVNLLGSTQYAAGKNAILNGAFNVAQRGTSVSIASGAAYTLDRWQGFRIGGVAGLTVSQQSGTAAGFDKCMRIQRDSANTSTAAISVNQSFETAFVYPLQGKTMTISFYAKSGANYSATTNNFVATIYGGTGTNGNIGTGFTGQTTLSTFTSQITTTFTRYSLTFSTFTSTYTQLAVGFSFSPTGTAGVNDFVDVTGVQLEVNSTASAFQTATGTIQGELAACQRYYYRTTPGIVAGLFGTGTCGSSTQSTLMGRYPVTMRAAPTALEQSGTATQYAVLYVTTTTICNAVPTFGVATTANDFIVQFPVASGLTAGQAGRSLTDATTGSTAFLGWSAEL